MTIHRARVTLWLLAGVAWLGVVWLAVLMWRTDLGYVYVARNGRADAPWYYRLAAVWGGAEGSLLLFAAIVGGVAATTATRVKRAGAAWGAAGTVASLLGTSVLTASPFDRLRTPASDGAGLQPILEHPAMAVHPPLLYIGLALTLSATMLAADPAVAERSIRRALRWAAAVLVGAMTLGALWSYLEQGWGGYWAWDPVENVSLIVWLVVIGSWHATHRRFVIGLGWVATLAGSAMVRSGRTPSIHGFSEHPGVGWALIALAVLSAGWWLLFPRTAVDTSPERRRGAFVTWAIAAVVAVGTFAPAVVGWLTGRRVAVRGEFFARVVGPLALLGVVAILIGSRYTLRGRARLAHIGILVLLCGIGATTFDREERLRVQAGEPVTAVGVRLVSSAAEVADGPRQGTSEVVVPVDIAGHGVRPSLVAYPALSGVLAEVAVVSRPWWDLQVALVSADDDGGAVLDVRRRPLVWLLWLGALLTTLGAVPRRVARACDATGR